VLSLQAEMNSLTRCWQAKKDSYAALVDEYKSYAYTIAFKILNNRSDAEEASQDAFIKAFHYLKNFNRQARFSTCCTGSSSTRRSATKERTSQTLSSIEYHDRAADTETASKKMTGRCSFQSDGPFERS